MRPATRLALAGFTVAAAIAGCSGTTPSPVDVEPSPAAADDRIAFTRWPELGVSHPQLWTGNADGSDLIAVGDQLGYFPDWSPDRTHLLFDFFDDAGVGQIATIRPDGSDFTQLTHGSYNSEAADYSPDATTIAFDAYEVPESDPEFTTWLMVMAADGENVRPLLDEADGGFDYEPEYSPDGTHITFIRFDPVADASSVYVVQADGRNVRQLTSPVAYAGHPRWSPDGTHIIYNVEDQSDLDDPRNGIWTVPAEGGEPSVLLATDDTLHGFKPDYSPSGDRILFGCLVRAEGAEALCVMNADGTKVERITRTPAFDNHPVWD